MLCFHIFCLFCVRWMWFLLQNFVVTLITSSASNSCVLFDLLLTNFIGTSQAKIGMKRIFFTVARTHHVSMTTKIVLSKSFQIPKYFPCELIVHVSLVWINFQTIFQVFFGTLTWSITCFNYFLLKLELSLKKQATCMLYEVNQWKSLL